MIVAEFSRINNGFRMRIEGHAGYGEVGKDIVCAATSGIAYALCGYLMNFKKDGFKVKSFERGKIDIECSADCEDYLQLACLGIYQIACEYPENVFVNIGAWNWKMMHGARSDHHINTL